MSTHSTSPTLPLQRVGPLHSVQERHTAVAPETLQAASPADIATGCPFLALIVPSDEGERQAQAMENLFQACSSDEPFALELVGTRREQGFVLRASSADQCTLLCKQIEAQYPQAQIARIAPHADPLRLLPGEHAVVGTFCLAQPSYLPLKTFTGKTLSEPGADPLLALLAGMEAVGTGQRIIAQLALVRAPERWLSADLRKSVEHALQPERDKQAAAMKQHTTGSDLAEGSKLLALLALLFGGLLALHWYRTHAFFPLALLGILLVFGLLAWVWWTLTHTSPPLYDMKLVAEKMARAGFYSQLRVIVIGQQATTSRKHLQTHLAAMEVVYRQFTLASSNSLVLKRCRVLRADGSSAQKKYLQRLTEVRYAFPYTAWWQRLLHDGAYSKQVLNALEAAGLFHLPQETADVPLLRRVSGKGLLASPALAQQLSRQSVPLPPACIGFSVHRRHRVPVYLPYDVLFSHKFLAGMSRSGKSVLIQLLTQAAMHPLQQTAQATLLQPGVFVADPHRDLILDILKLVPPARMQDVILLDLTETDYPVALNPLDASMGLSRDQAVSNLMSSFQRIWAEQWGPRMAYFLNSVCLLLYTLNEQLVQQGRAEEQYTLLDINPLLQYKDYATQVLSHLDMQETWHQELLVFWQTTYFTLNPAFKNEVIMPIISKIGVFHDNLQLRRIVGQPVTNAPIQQAITDGKIVLCALSARDMDEQAVNILGSTLMNLLHRAFGLQQELPLLQRRKVFVAIDEFQHFSGSDFATLLSEDAKYGCAMLLATQSLTRLNKIRDGLLDIVLSNCQHLWVFRVSAADAKLMATELQERVSVKHIISQANLHCYARLAITGVPLQVISLALTPPTSWHDDPTQVQLATAIRHRQQQHAHSAAEIDRRYTAHIQHFLSVGAYASRIQREARATRVTRAEREEAENLAHELSADLHAAQLVTGTKRPTGPLTESGARQTPAQGTKQHVQQKQHANVTESAASPVSTEGKPVATRNHRRSRHMGKQRVGVPPPEPPTTRQQVSPLPPTPQEEAITSDEPATPSAGGQSFSAGGMSWGTALGYEQREGRERG